jgi:hypothetical protein
MPIPGVALRWFVGRHHRADAPATARSAPSVTSSQAVKVASFDAGATAREMINANGTLMIWS